MFKDSTKACEIENPCEWSTEKTELVVSACREMALFHYANCKEIKFLYDKNGFDPKTIKSEKDLERIPAIGVTAMKYYLMTSMDHKKMVLKLTSSGTRGQKTQIWFDQGSLDRVQRMLDVYLDQEGFVSKEKNNYLVLSYDPNDAKDLGVAYTEENQLRFAPVNRSYFAVKKDESGEWGFDKERAFEILKSYEEEGLPTRIFGMPAFLFDFINYLGDRKVTLAEGSLMITGGGWKAAEDKMISRDEFRTMCGESFGIKEEMIRDAYGMAEHSAPYFECKCHRFHVPVYNRLITRDPISMKPTRKGEKGVLELITPFNSMMPTLAILSTDWAVIHEDPCPCGANSPTFSILGRAGISKHKGCAIHAEDIIKRGGKR